MTLRISFARRAVPGQRDEASPSATLLRERGHQVVERTDGPLFERSAGGRAPDLLWIHGNAAWFPRLRRDLLRRAPAERPTVVVYHFEPLPPSRASGLPPPRRHLRELVKAALRDSRATDPWTNARILARLRGAGLPDVLAVTTASRVEFLAEMGVPSVLAPFGGHPRFGADLGLERNVDVLLLGTLDVPRRRAALERLRAEGIAVTCQFRWSDPAGFGDRRTELLNRTRILINLARHPGEFSGLRFVLGACNGALVVSEPVYRPEPFVPGHHFVETTLHRMADTIRRYLEDERERAAIAAAARRLVDEELTLAASMDRVLEALGAAGAASRSRSRSDPASVRSRRTSAG